MTLRGEYLDMMVAVDDLDKPVYEFYERCGHGTLHMQTCSECELMRFPPGAGCPWCTSFEYDWKPVSGKGHVYSYSEVHHAIQTVFRAHTPYMLLLVELDEQVDEPSEYDGLRLTGNLASADGELARPEYVATVGIGTRVKVVFKQLGDGLALPLWTVDDEAEQPTKPWRYAD